MALSDLALRRLKPKPKPYKVFDEKGLFIHVQTNGSRYWRFKYEFGKREKLLSMGSYPAVTLAQARVARDGARRLLKQGLDPSTERKTEKDAAARAAAAKPVGKTFEEAAREFIETRKTQWTPYHQRYALARLQGNIFGLMGSKPIADITPAELLAAIRVVEARGATEMSHRTRELCSQVFRYGIACGDCSHDPAHAIMNALVPHVAKGMKAVPLEEFPQLLRDIDGYPELQTRYAMQLLCLTFVRTSELIGAEWSEIDVERAPPGSDSGDLADIQHAIYRFVHHFRSAQNSLLVPISSKDAPYFKLVK